MRKKIRTKIILDDEEKQIEQDLKEGLFKPIKNEKLFMKDLQTVAKNQLKGKRINLRINSDDLEKFEKEARRMGIAYQSLVGSVLHRYITDQLVDIREVRKIERKKAS